MKFFFSILFSLPFVVQGQQFQLLKKIYCDPVTFTSNHRGDLFIATPTGVKWYNKDGDSLGYYSKVARGEITAIDATNPLRTLLFFKDIPQITVLNRMLTEQTTLDLKKINIYNCPAIAYSADGDTWLYNTFTFELKKINDDLSFQPISINLQQLLRQNINPSQIIESDRYVYVVDSAYGIVKFDRFGAYITTYSIHTKAAQVINNQIIYIEGDSLQVYNTRNITSKSIRLPDASGIKAIRIEKGRMYILRKDGLEIYQADFGKK